MKGGENREKQGVNDLEVPRVRPCKSSLSLFNVSCVRQLIFYNLEVVRTMTLSCYDDGLIAAKSNYQGCVREHLQQVKIEASVRQITPMTRLVTVEH